MEYRILRKENGDVPLEHFLADLPQKHHAKTLREIDILEKYGTNLTEPHVKHIEGKLWELRIKFASDISRIFYFFAIDSDIILLSGFIKKTQKTPMSEINKAKSYLYDYERRKMK